MSLKYERRLLEHLKHETYAPAKVEALAGDLGITEDALGEFEHAVDALVERGVLVQDGVGRVQLPKLGDTATGRFKKNQRGFGFVMTDTAFREGDVFIPPDAVGDALTGDRVRIAIKRGGRNGENDRTGVILEVLDRKRANFTGELVKRGGMWLVMPDGRELTSPIVVDDPAVKNARVGDKVSVEITSYPEGPNELANGVIVKVLGEAGLPDVETAAVIEMYALPGEFPKECVEQARRATQQFDREVAEAERTGWKDRIDLRDEFVVTIDPPDAKDYDDALHINARSDGGWDVGIHIADVAHFIPPGSMLDDEARKRGNSVYLPRLVIPMLPEVLSNGICSLSEGVIRFTKSAFVTYDSVGNVMSERVGATIIKSAKRMTYLEAQALIDGDLKEARKHAKTEPKYSEKLIKALRDFDSCSKAIRARRKKQGMIHLDLPEVNLVFDDAGHVVDAQPEDNAYTHTLIEMFMVEANEVLARLFAGLEVPLLRRVHPEPTPGDVGDLRKMAKVAGYSIPKNPTRQELQALLDATAGTPAARAVHFAVLRTLTKAEYSPALIGHFALASEAYAHFTSPIRRYPDLTVHRALAAYLDQTENGAKGPRREADRHRLGDVLKDLGPERGVLDQDELVEIGRHCSNTEVNAESAEQTLRQFLVLQLLVNHLGEQFGAVVTGVTGAGVFVQLDKFLAEGMIKSQDLPVPGGQTHGRWVMDQRTGALVHPPSGRSMNVGDRVTVVIAAINLALRQMDLVIADGQSRNVGKGKQVGKVQRGESPKDRVQGGPSGDDFFHPNRQSGTQRRSQQSKARDQSKAGHRPGRGKPKGGKG